MIDLFEVNVILTSCCASVLVLAYLITLIKVRMGSKYAFITALILTLIVSNVGTLMNIYATYELFVKNSYTLTNVLLLCIGEAMQDTGFSVAHWAFASKYFRIGTQMPFKIKGEEVPEEIEAS